MQDLYSLGENNNKGPYTSVAIYLLGISIMGIMVFFGGRIMTNFDKLKGHSALTIDSYNQQAEVFINGKSVGTTPYESKSIIPGENKITLKTKDQMYETKLNFLPDTSRNIYNVVVFRDMGISNVFSSGQEFWYDKDSGNTKLKVISDPPGATVYVDDVEVGKTPFSSSTLSLGEYNVKVSQEGFEKQEMKIATDKNNTLNIKVKLFPLPTPSVVTKFEGSENLYQAYTDNEPILANTKTWVDAILYWNRTRGITLDGVGANKEIVFDYYIDYRGNLFNKEGKPTTQDQINKVSRGIYLGRVQDGPGLTALAKETFETLTNQVITAGKKATVLETGMGWLRVRSGPSVESAEVQKVNVGQSYDVLDEQNGWIKLKLNPTTTGWALKEYLSIK